MKKSLLLFIAALCATVALNAKTITLEPGENKIETAIASAQAGDVIELTGDADNVYTERHSITIDKAITLRAAEGAKPVVKINKWIIAAAFEANGIEFTNLENDYMLRTSANLDATITLKNCYMHDSSSPFVYTSSYTVGGLVIDSCIFANNTRDESGIILSTGEISNFEMRNSTISKITGKYAVQVKTISKAVIDHCTIYDCGKHPLLIGEGNYNADHEAPIDVAVSNCVISNPTEVEGQAIACYGGTADNCVWNNTAENPRYLIKCTNVVKANPQFINPANGNLNFALTSPLFLAATDDSNIGDPRWGVEEPETAIEVPGTLPVMDAVLQGTKISKSEEGIKWNDNSANPDDNTASWVIDVAKAGTYEVVINSATTATAHKYRVCLASVNAWLDVKAEPEHLWKEGDFSIGTFTIPEAGTYMIRMMNEQVNSSTEVKSLTMKYLGGAVVDVPASLPIEDAIVNGPRVSKAEGGLQWNNSSDDASSFVTWNINVTKAGDYEVIVNENTGSGHNYSVTIENDQETLPDVGEGKDVWESGDISLGIISIANTGVYTVKLTNTTFNSKSFTNSLSLNYIGGGIVNVPGILPAEDALLSGNIIRLENGSVKWPNKDDVNNHYVTWNINATVAGDVDVIAHIGVPPVGEDASSHNFTATLYQGETAISSIPEPKKTSATGEITFGTLNIPEAGVYALRLTNAVKWSSAIVDALELKEAQVIETIEIGDDQTDVDFTAYAGQTVNIKLNRTIKADMFTPFCLPFALHSGALNSVLKSDKAYVLDDAQIQDQTLSVKLQTYSSIYQGTPFLIKPTEEVVDPIFENVTIMNDPQASSTTKGNVTFQGSFAKENLTESDKVLLVGNNNTLFYPNDATTPYIKSMRAYFRVNVEANKLPRFAAFVEPGNAPTEMIIVGGEAERQKGHRKVLVDGQIRIQHEGKCYSILGLER